MTKLTPTDLKYYIDNLNYCCDTPCPHKRKRLAVMLDKIIAKLASQYHVEYDDVDDIIIDTITGDIYNELCEYKKSPAVDSKENAKSSGELI